MNIRIIEWEKDDWAIEMGTTIINGHQTKEEALKTVKWLEVYQQLENHE